MKASLLIISVGFLFTVSVSAQENIVKKCISGNCENGPGIAEYGSPIRATFSGNFQNGKPGYGPCTITFTDGSKLTGKIGNSEGWLNWFMNGSFYDRSGKLVAKDLNGINYIQFTPSTIYGQPIPPMVGYGNAPYGLFARFSGKDDQVKTVAFSDYYIKKTEDLNSYGDPRSAASYAFEFTNPKAFFYSSLTGQLLKTSAASGYEGSYKQYNTLIEYMKNIVPDPRWSGIRAKERGDGGCTVISNNANGMYFYDVPDPEHPSAALITSIKNKDVVHLATDNIILTPSFDGKLLLLYGEYKGKKDQQVSVGYILDLANGGKKLMDFSDKAFNDVMFKTGFFSNTGDSMIFYSNRSTYQEKELKFFNLKTKKWIGTKSIKYLSDFGFYSPELYNLTRNQAQAPFPSIEQPLYLTAINGNGTLALYVNRQSIVIMSIDHPEEWGVLNNADFTKDKLVKELQTTNNLIPYQLLEQDAYHAWVSRMIAAREAYYRQFEAEQQAKVRSRYSIPIGKTICSQCHGSGIVNVSGGRQSVQETPDIDVYEVDKLGNKKLVKTIYGHYNQVDIVNGRKCASCGGKGYY